MPSIVSSQNRLYYIMKSAKPHDPTAIHLLNNIISENIKSRLHIHVPG